MADPNATRPSLLVQIRDAEDQHAWSQFVELYAPLIYGFARKHALQDADAADLTQEVLRTVARTVQTLNYDPNRGSFRGWLFTVVRNKLRDLITARNRRAQASGDTSDQQRFLAMPDPTSEESAEWDLDHERRLFAWAAEKVRAEVEDSTWRAFWQTAVDGRSGKNVASDLGLSIAAVYLAKSRVMARLKAKIKEIDPLVP